MNFLFLEKKKKNVNAIMYHTYSYNTVYRNISDMNWKVEQFAHLFTKWLWPEDSEETFLIFKSSYHLLLPV